MIKVFVEYRPQKGVNIESVLRKLRSHAMAYSGFIGAENLRSEKDSSIVIMASTWLDLQDWRAWENSRVRAKILQSTEKLLLEESRVTIYRIIPVTESGEIESLA